LFSLGATIMLDRTKPPPRSVSFIGRANDNAGAAGDGGGAGECPVPGFRWLQARILTAPRDEPAAPEPLWGGPGAVLSLRATGGRHGIGSVRAAGEGTRGDPLDDVAILFRLLAHYGSWMGFEGLPEPGPVGALPQRRAVAGGPGRVEYRLDLRRIRRTARTLLADGTVLLDGRPVAVVAGLSIAFRAAASPRRAARTGMPFAGGVPATTPAGTAPAGPAPAARAILVRPGRQPPWPPAAPVATAEREKTVPAEAMAGAPDR